MQKTHGTSRILSTLAMTTLAGFALAGCANGGNGDEGAETGDAAEQTEPDNDTGQEDGQNGDESALATADLADPDGESLGHVEFVDGESGVEVAVEAENMDPGFYGFHIHEVGECEPDSEAPDDPEDTGDFMSAGSHIAGEDDADHPDHAGDLPVLLVNEDGTAQMSVVTDRLDESLLLEDDGAAVIVHSDEDNFAHVPERYLDDGESAPDDDTMSTGDAGDRLACGVVEG